MPRKGYSLQERDRIREALLNEGQRVLSRKGFKATTLDEVFEAVGISKTFFYKFFSSKEQFAREVVVHQQPLFVDFLQTTMSRKDGGAFAQRLKRFYLDICDSKSGFFVPTVPDFQSMRKRATIDEQCLYRECLRSYGADLMKVLGIPADAIESSIFFNLFMQPILVKASMGGINGLCEPLSHVDQFNCVIEVISDFFIKRGASVTESQAVVESSK